MDKMEWFGSVLLGLLAANNLGSCLALAEICQTFGLPQCQGDMGHGMSKISHTGPSQHCDITHWTATWRKWNGFAVPCLVCWLQTSLVLFLGYC
jgi:hypothetical protein